jgi:hypothetical protein
MVLAAALLGLSCQGSEGKETAAGKPEHSQAAFEAAARELGRKPWSEAFPALEKRFGAPVTLPFREVFPDVVKALRDNGKMVPEYIVHTWSAAPPDGATCSRLTAIADLSPSQLAVQSLPSDPGGPMFLAYSRCRADARASAAKAP